MTATTHNLQQGTPEWHAFRDTKYGASEAPVMMGKSKYQNRSDLVKQKATGITPEVDANKQFLFDKGHAAEIGGRALAEKILGEELSPVVMSMSEDVYGLPLSASLDGINFGGDIIFEHKLWNADLAQQIDNRMLDEHYTIQMDQQLLISGAEKCLFVASNGTEHAYMWYTTSPDKFNKLIQGWMQFKEDVSAYVPTAEAATVTAEAVMALPALSVQIKGEVTTSNLPVFVSAADAFLAKIKTVLETDQDFADAEANVKACKAAEDGIEQTKKAITAQATSIYEVMRTMDLYKEKLSTVRLKLDKLVKSEKEARKAAIVQAARMQFNDYVLVLEAETKPIRITMPMPVFADAIKGLKSLSSMQEATDTMLRDSKFAASQLAQKTRSRLTWFNDAAKGYEFLFPDLQQLIMMV